MSRYTPPKPRRDVLPEQCPACGSRLFDVLDLVGVVVVVVCSECSLEVGRLA